jgi:Ca2+-binding RTX toxin-like protein
MASLTFTIEGEIRAQITVTENGTGGLIFNVTLLSNTATIGDLRALYFDVSNESLLSGLSVSGTDVTGDRYAANAVTFVDSRDTNVNGEVINEFGKFDVGVELGTAGIGSDDIQSTEFVLTHDSLDLTLDLIALQDFAVRITSVGEEDGERDDSLKLGATAPDADTGIVILPDGGVTLDYVFQGGPGNDYHTVVGGNGVDTLGVTSNGAEIVQITSDGQAPDGHLLIDFDNDAQTDLTVSGVEELVVNAQHVVVFGDLSHTGLAADTIIFNGTEGDDSFDASGMTSTETVNAFGFGGLDTLVGAGGSDVLDGGSGNDLLSGLGGRDILIGGAGADVLNGGAEIDSAGYSNSAGGLVVDLLTPANNTGDAAGDTYISIEGVIGGAFDDQLYGDNAATNILEGGAGADLLDGRGGSDSASYRFAPVGVTASLADPGINTGDAAGDAYVSIEHLIGSAFDDVLVGDGQLNFLTGGPGADVLDGGANFDWADYFRSTVGLTADLSNSTNNTGDAAGDIYIGMEGLRGSAFDDILIGNSLNNTISGGLGADVLDGGAGADTAFYLFATSGVTADLSNPANNTGEAAGDIYISIENLRGSNFADTLVGNGLNQFLTGGLGADVLDGGAGFDWADYASSVTALTADLSNPANNTGEAAGDIYIAIENLRGSDFNDVLIGDEGLNTLTGNNGADQLIGGAGTDTADYLSAAAGVTADLSNPANNTGAAAGDTYDSIENLRGSNFADILVGDAFNNFLAGGPGADVLIGGGGFDFADYNGVPTTTGVTVDLSNLANNTGNAAGDTYDSIEAFVGTPFDDVFIGDADGNDFRGGAGADAYYGGDGIDQVGFGFPGTGGVTADFSNPLNNTGSAAGDTYDSIEIAVGSDFNDVLVASDSGMTLYGRGGADILIGGNGSDTLVGEGGIDVFVFAEGSGIDYIVDFAAGDVIDLSGIPDIDFDDVLMLATDNGTDTTINFGGGNSIIIQNVLESMLNLNDFSFG